MRVCTRFQARNLTLAMLPADTEMRGHYLPIIGVPDKQRCQQVEVVKNNSEVIHLAIVGAAREEQTTISLTQLKI